MTRAVYVLRDGELVERHHATPHPKAGHFIISDNLPDTWNPMNGKRYSSKGKYYADVRAMGGEIVGNDPAGIRERKANYANPEPAPLSVKRAIEQLRSSR